jgi:hypothetical protein
MGIGVSEFIANFQGGGARPNLYRVTIIGGPAGFNEKTAFLCKAASLPQSMIGLADVSYMGRKIKVAGDKEFPAWTASFYNDLDFETRDKFEYWLSEINAHEANTGLVNPRDYYADIRVEQLSREGGDAIKTYTIKDAFPTEVGEITLGYDQNDTVEEYPVTFEYNYWISDTTE